MLDGKTFLPVTGTPIRKIACMRSPLAEAEPVPFGVAILNAKSLVRSMVKISFPLPAARYQLPASRYQLPALSQREQLAETRAASAQRAPGFTSAVRVTRAQREAGSGKP